MRKTTDLFGPRRIMMLFLCAAAAALGIQWLLAGSRSDGPLWRIRSPETSSFRVFLSSTGSGLYAGAAKREPEARSLEVRAWKRFWGFEYIVVQDFDWHATVGSVSPGEPPRSVTHPWYQWEEPELALPLDGTASRDLVPLASTEPDCPWDSRETQHTCSGRLDAHVRVPTWFAMLLLLLWPAAAYVRGPLRRRFRRRLRLCVECGYDRSGNATDVCPECGARNDTEL